MGFFSGLAGPLISGGLSFLGGERQNQANAKQSASQTAFQERMSTTAHQREVKDLRAAGLNPILSAGGKGASTPSGSMATIQNSAKDGVEGYTKTALLKAQIKLLGDQANNQDSSAAANTTQAQLNRVKAKTEALQQLQIIANTAGVQQTNALQKIDLDMFSNAELLKNAKTLGIDANTLKTLMNLFRSKK